MEDVTIAEKMPSRESVSLSQDNVDSEGSTSSIADQKVVSENIFFTEENSESTATQDHSLTTVMEDSETAAVENSSDGTQSLNKPAIGSDDLSLLHASLPSIAVRTRNQDVSSIGSSSAAETPIQEVISFGSPSVSELFSPSTSSPMVRLRSSELGMPNKATSAGIRTPKSTDALKQMKNMDGHKGLIDTTAPFESVKQAVSKFGGIVDWKAHRIQTVERCKLVDQELEKIQDKMPELVRQSDIAEAEKVRVLSELDSTKRVIEELKINLERAQTEEHQAKQDSELAILIVEEMEQGIGYDASVAAKAQLEVAKARYSTAVSELKYNKDELEAIRKEYACLVIEKDIAVKKAEEAISASKETDRMVEDLTIELIATKASLESAHSTHLETEEQRMGAALDVEKESLHCQKELKHAEGELQTLKQQILAHKDLEAKLESASALLIDLKAELAAYMESKLNSKGETDIHTDIQQAVASAQKELEEVKLKIEKATKKVNCIKLAAVSLQTELESEKLAITMISQGEGISLVAVTSTEAELEQTKLDIALVQMKDKEAQEKIAELPKSIQEAAKEADEAKSLVEIAREELRKAKEDAEHARAEASTIESKLLAAQKEIEATRTSEKLALAAIKALEKSESAKMTNDMDSPTGVTLSLEDYFELTKRAHEAEEQANMRVTAAMCKIEVAKESELKISEKLEEVNQEMTVRKESLGIAMDKAEKAKDGKLGVEQELRKWRAEHEERRKTPNPENVVIPSFDRKMGSNNLDKSSHNTYVNASNSENDSSTDTKVVKKKKRSFFPRIFMFLGRRRAQSNKSM